MSYWWAYPPSYRSNVSDAEKYHPPPIYDVCGFWFFAVIKFDTHSRDRLRHSADSTTAQYVISVWNKKVRWLNKRIIGILCVQAFDVAP